MCKGKHSEDERCSRRIKPLAMQTRAHASANLVKTNLICYNASKLWEGIVLGLKNYDDKPIRLKM